MTHSVLSSDLVYVLLFPQLLLVLYWNEYCNSYGCIASFSTGFLFRVLGNNSIVNKTKLLFSNGRLGCQFFNRR